MCKVKEVFVDEDEDERESNRFSWSASRHLILELDSMVSL